MLDKAKVIPTLLALGVFAVFALFTLVWYEVMFGGTLYRWETRGQAGEAINSLFSGLALLGVLVTVLLQSRELSLQREELRLTREQVERSADAQREQVEQMREAAELQALSALVAAIDLKARLEAPQEPISGWDQRLDDIIMKLNKRLE